ncbi:hypothetical protein [Streptomyces rishiriensis]|uniref:hypothetical protein n=1 Tax=Streptomyces rishiriensis TaxID=68264 RepID=UPI00131F1F8D|nr:hypothetical protein [Streptomyces rishiriensis]
MGAEFTPEARAHADQAVAAIEAGDWAAAEEHLNAVADSSPADRIVLGAVIHETRQQTR